VLQGRRETVRATADAHVVVEEVVRLGAEAFADVHEELLPHVPVQVCRPAAAEESMKTEPAVEFVG